MATYVRMERTDDPRIAAYRDLTDPELVRSRGLFIAEGRLAVRRIIEDGRWRVQSVLVSEAARNGLQLSLDRIADRVPVYVCAASAFLGITGHDIHRGCLALVERPPAQAPDALVRVAQLVVVLEGVTNADNVGGIFRNAAAFGADAVLLSPTCCDPLYRKAIRTSMAAVLRVPFARFDAWPHGLVCLREAGYTIVALTPRAPATTLEEFSANPRPQRIALVVGTEGEGLSPALEEIADVRVRIPIADAVDSLNVAVASGIALYGLQNSR
jgi:tRNA G18 (ribose-2'-O)-methylase SpoU